MSKKKTYDEWPRRAWIAAAIPWVLSSLALAAVMIAGLIVFQKIEQVLIEDPRFTLGSKDEYAEARANIRVAGVEHASMNRIMKIFAADNGSLYLLPLEERRRQLLTVDWVKNASVARIWPNRVQVRVEERRPVAFVQLPPRKQGVLYQVALIDEEGVILQKPPDAAYDLPVLTGIQESHSAAMRALRVRRMQRLCAEIGNLSERVSEIDVADPNNLKARMNAHGDSVLLTLGRENYVARLKRFLDHYPEIHRRLPAAATFDLRLDDRITALDGVKQ